MKILVTGSEGLIGSTLCKKLKREHTVERFDLKLGHNILNFKQLKKAMKKCDGVIHLAAVSRVVHAYHKPMKAIRHNIFS